MTCVSSIDLFMCFRDMCLFFTYDDVVIVVYEQAIVPFKKTKQKKTIVDRLLCSVFPVSASLVSKNQCSKCWCIETSLAVNFSFTLEFGFGINQNCIFFFSLFSNKGRSSVSFH